MNTVPIVVLGLQPFHFTKMKSEVLYISELAIFDYPMGINYSLSCVGIHVPSRVILVH